MTDMFDPERPEARRAAEERLYTKRVDRTFRWLGVWIGGGYILLTLWPILDGLTPLAILLLCVLLWHIPTLRRKADNYLDMRRGRKELKKIDSEVLRW